jgi:hypothetical protein
MRAFVASLIGGGIGFAQVIILAIVDSSNDDRSRVPQGDIAYWVFAATWMAETISVIAISMYRFSPFIVRVMGDDWEADRINKGRRSSGPKIEMAASAAIVVRRIVQYMDIGHISAGTVIGLTIATFPFLIPHPIKRNA